MATRYPPLEDAPIDPRTKKFSRPWAMWFQQWAALVVDLVTEVAGTLPLASLPVHASTHGTAGEDPLTAVAVQVDSLAAGGALVAGTVATFRGQYVSPLIADDDSGANKTIDWAQGNEHYVTLTDDCAFTFTNPVNGGRYVLLVNTGAGGYMGTWPATVMWADPPTVTAAAGRLDLFTFIYVSALGVYFGAYNQDYPVS
jgi:hypothetical protein